MSDFLDPMDGVDYSDIDVADPNRYPFLNELDLDLDVRKRLSAHFDRTVSGNSDVYVTPLAKEHKPQSILDSWIKIFESNKSKVNSTLLDLEKSNLSKFGPRSLALPWKDRLPGVSSYFEAGKCSVPPNLLYQSRPSRRGYLRPLEINKAVKYLKNDTNSGLPYYTRKGKILPRLVSRFRKLILRKDPCIIFTRTQESYKTRTVWGFPIADTLNEMMFYRPLLDYQRKLKWRSALVGPNEVDRRVTELIDRAIKEGLSLISVDFSQFDASAKKELQDAAFDYIRCLFQQKYHDDLDYIRDRFNTISLLTPSGIIKGSHGVPSGSTFTNEVDSLIQYIVATASGVVDPDMIQAQGDDGVYAVLDSLLHVLFATFKESGLLLNEEKSYISKEFVIFLQCLYHIEYRQENGLIGGIYPTFRALNRLIYQERWSKFEDYSLDGKDYYSIRAISILENCKYHPLFEEFVSFVYSLDKYSLEFSKGSENAYAKMYETGSGVGGFLNNQYGDNVRGIRSFETYKIIQKLRNKR